MSRGVAIAPPSTLNDEHLPKLDTGKKKKEGSNEVTEDSPLLPVSQKLQELRARLVS